MTSIVCMVVPMPSDHNPAVGFNPYRKRAARRSDVVFLAGAAVIALACVLWVLLG